MPKERIVLETTDQRKAALVHTLEIQGDTLAGWLEEQLSLSLPEFDPPNTVSKLAPCTLSDLADSEKLLNRLKAQDWAFTDDDTRYLTHDLHPYPAKFIPQLPAHLIDCLSIPGDIIFDPFGGSATTAVEAVRLGRRALSLDANPLSGVIGRVKTGLMNIPVRAELEQLQAAVTSYVASPETKKAHWASMTAARHTRFIPDIPNIDKWFAETAIAELALLRFLIDEMTSELATDAALLALSRIVLRVSNQESETRYVAEAKEITPGLTLRAFLESLRTVVRRLEHAAPELQRADARFVVADSRKQIREVIGDCSVDLIVTSPPYPNATDYHLYHRFRLFWLGFDPRKLGLIEIGSHLRHQRNGSGFEEYREDIAAVLGGCYAVLQPGRYGVFIAGDALFKGELFSTSQAIASAAREIGFDLVGLIERPIHQTKRSFAQPARRARREFLIILRKPDRAVEVTLAPPAYRMWDYEVTLRRMEIEALTGQKARGDCTRAIVLKASLAQLSAFRRLTFTHEYFVDSAHSNAQPTWQKVLENGDANGGKRKDPKYATHGLHPFKGKFYPQLTKALMNISGVSAGARILDPFCGSGTVLLESMLNGFAAFGCDMNPLAAKIARAKTGIFGVDRRVTEQALRSLQDRLARAPQRLPSTRDQFDAKITEELDKWFPSSVLDKLEWILTQIRIFGEPRFVEFCEIVLSSIVRQISQQDPTDLRIRRRKVALNDAPVNELFAQRLAEQLDRLVRYWSIAGRQPGSSVVPVVREGDCRNIATFAEMGIASSSVDCIITSPPYATALPYIDTDRLSLMAILGIDVSVRSVLETKLIGSREIRRSEKESFENQLTHSAANGLLPESVVAALRNILRANRDSDVGFRRDNMAALLWRYFRDMHDNLVVVRDLLKPGSSAFYVVGDSRTKAGENWTAVETCSHICKIAEMVGLETRKLLDISVTTENYMHMKNSITENAIFEFRRSL